MITKKDFVDVQDFTKEEFLEMLHMIRLLKEADQKGIQLPPGRDPVGGGPHRPDVGEVTAARPPGARALRLSHDSSCCGDRPR